MLLTEALARERERGGCIKVVSQIRDSMGELSVKMMAKYFKVKECVCEEVIGCIAEHPDWDDEQIAEHVDWE